MPSLSRHSSHVSSEVAEELTGADKLRRVQELLQILETDFEKKNLLPPQRNAKLEELKLYTRSVDDADPLFTKNGLLVLSRQAFLGSSFTTGRIALKCLANVMLLESSMRQTFVDLGFAPKAAERLKSDNHEDEFLATRVLFLTTYDTNLNFNDLFEQNQLVEAISTNLGRHAKHFANATTKKPVLPAEILALSETLKLFFNLTQFYPEEAPNFTKSLLHILKIFANVKIPAQQPLQPPITYLINSLVNLDLEDKKARYFAQNPLFPKFDPNLNAKRFCTILDGAVRSYTTIQLEQLVCPLLTVIRKVFDFAPDPVRLQMRAMLLPADEERVKPLGKSDSLPSFLLRLSSVPEAPNLREAISNMLFELSDKDATSFVRNVGYGFASGFLLGHDMPIPENALEAWSTGRSGDETLVGGSSSSDGRGSVDLGEKITNVNGHEINPVTGQRRDMEALMSAEAEAKMGPEMTQEEKEREAEKLFVLFERLRATGVVNVENPVRTALQSGRFEEIE